MMRGTIIATKAARKRRTSAGRPSGLSPDRSQPPEAASTPSAGTSSREQSPTDPQRARRLSDVPPKYRDLYRRAYAGKSRKAAIRAHCLECVYWSIEEVRRCTDPACPLYEFRLKG